MAREPSAGLLLRQRAVRRKKRRRRAVGVGALLVAVGLVYLVAFSPVLTAQQVAVVGQKVLSVDQVRQAAQVPLGTPLARLDIDAIASRVTQLEPVRSVQVTRSWPQAVTITVRERQAVLAVRQGDGQYRLVDDTGVGFHTVAQPPTGLVVTTTDQPDLWDDLATVVVALSTKLRAETSMVAAKGPDDITVQMANKASVQWGSGDRSAEKAIVLESLRRAAPQARVYNVSAPEHPTTR